MALFLLVDPLRLPEEVGQRDFQSVREFRDRYDAWTALAALDPTDVVAVDAGFKAQCLLAQAAFLPRLVKRLPKSLQDTIRLRHGSDRFRMSEIALQPERVPADRPAMQPERVSAESPRKALLGLLGLVAFFVGGVAVIAILVTLVFRPGSEGSAPEWTGVGRVCDFDGECQDDFKCRSANGTIEIYLPYGSFSTGNDGWEWRQDTGRRCGQPPA